MNVFNDHAFEIKRQIVVGKVPEAIDAKLHQALCRLKGNLLGYAQNSGARRVRTAEIFKFRRVADDKIADRLADNMHTVVKNSDQPKAAAVKIHMARNGASKVASADQNHRHVAAKPHNVADLLMQRSHVIAVTLLSKPAETV